MGNSESAPAPPRLQLRRERALSEMRFATMPDANAFDVHASACGMPRQRSRAIGDGDLEKSGRVVAFQPDGRWCLIRIRL